MISFRRGKTKVHIKTEARTPTPIDDRPLYVEAVHMLDGLAADEMNSFPEEHSTIITLFKVDVLSAMQPYVATDIKHEAPYEPDSTSIKELQ